MTKTDKADKKAHFLEALSKTMGNVTLACKAVNIHRSTYYDWTNPEHAQYDKEFQDNVKINEEERLDFVESKQFELINGITMAIKDKNGQIKRDEAGNPRSYYTTRPDTRLIMHHLETKGKKRGYAKRSDLVDDDGTPLITGLEIKVSGSKSTMDKAD